MRNYSLFKSGMFHLQLSLQTFVWSNFDEISKFFQRKIIYWLFDYTTERRMRILCSTRKQKTTLIAYKDLMKGKLFQSCTHLLYCRVLSLGGNLNTRWMSKPDMRSIFHIKNHWNILVIGNYYVNYQNYQIKCFLPPRILNEHWCIYSCLQIPPKGNWFQYVRRVYIDRN